MVRRWRTLLACVCVLPLTGFALTSAASAAGKAGCTKVAGPNETAQGLVDALAPGETGCLRAGIYKEEELTLATPDIRLTSYPSERATLAGRVRVTADGVTVNRLRLDGRNLHDLPSPTINADEVSFRRNDVSNPGSASCFILGSITEVRHTVIARNRIHGCGKPGSLLDHGIYMQDVDGARIVRNTIYDNASRGIKIGPDSQRALIQGNVIDGNPIGLNFSGNDTSASSGNVVTGNVIANSTRWWNVQSYWPGPVGRGNIVRRNCVHGGNPDSDYNEDGGISDDSGFTATQNLIAAPDYVHRSAKDFRLRSMSRCRAVYGPRKARHHASPHPQVPEYLGPLAAAIIELQRLIQVAVAYSDSARLLGALQE
jgi:nitrous oxidase accessory protein NosD